MIELEDVVKLQGAQRVVDHVSFTVARGEFCALVGSSGAGKSTTLKMVNRLIPMSAGTIRIGGEDITTLPPEALRRRIGYVIQSIGLFPHWTVAENIATVPRLLGWPQARIAARTAELMALLRLDPALHGAKHPHELSGGQQQRVGFARALAADPELLLMDEPFGALDPITREALAAELALIHRRTRKTTLFVTHDLDMALAMADQVAIMHQGRLRQFAPPRDILEHPADEFVRDFVGRSGLGLKLLGVRKVAERARAEGAAPGEAIDQSASLAEALSEMVVRHATQVPVRDASGAVTGSVALDDLVR
jgi:osmoprotectant transport system ATP-binding protein